VGIGPFEQKSQCKLSSSWTLVANKEADRGTNTSATAIAAPLQRSRDLRREIFPPFSFHFLLLPHEPLFDHDIRLPGRWSFALQVFNHAFRPGDAPECLSDQATLEPLETLQTNVRMLRACSSMTLLPEQTLEILQCGGEYISA